MRNFKSTVDDDKDLFYKLIEIYQTAYYSQKDYATKREKEFLWASLNVQKDTGTKRLFKKSALEAYEEMGFTESNVNNYSKSLHIKKLANRDQGEFMLVPCMETFSSKNGIKISIDIIVEEEK